MLVVPLKFMCSTQCETPVRPGRSSLEPTLYQHHTEARGAVCSSWTMTLRPLSSVVARIVLILLMDTHARVEGHRQPAANRLSDEGEPPEERAGNARAVGVAQPLPEDSGGSRRRAEVRTARRPALRQRQHPHGHGDEQ